MRYAPARCAICALAVIALSGTALAGPAPVVPSLWDEGVDGDLADLQNAGTNATGSTDFGDWTDVGVLPNLQESFIFWRVSKGGPGLPEEGGPWDTAMPAWETFLDEQEMWDVTAYLYEFSGYDPRKQEVHH